MRKTVSLLAFLCRGIASEGLLSLHFPRWRPEEHGQAVDLGHNKVWHSLAEAQNDRPQTRMTVQRSLGNYTITLRDLQKNAMANGCVKL